jgi:F-type H+-transporting ATPase subunit c
VNKFVRISVMCLVIVLGLATSAFAAASTVVAAGGALGVGLTVIGAAYGIGRLAGSALESMARQPEVAGSIQTAMIIAAALIEGFTFYALYICSTAAVNGF